MVRKRSKGAKRHYESDDEPETESDFEDDPAYEPAPKKYSLRQRKRTTFNSDDWEYEDDILTESTEAKAPSDEEINDVHNEPKVDEEAGNENVEDSTDINTTEPSVDKPVENDEELVDFEDMIRADIVVNKNRIDYDNIIQKTEIKVQPLPEKEKVDPKVKPIKPQSPMKPKGKRGRKPKRKSCELEEPQYFAPQIQEDENDEDYHPYKPKRTRKQKKRPAGEIDSSLLDGFEQDDEFEDQNDRDYDPEDDLLDMDYPGLSTFILNKQLSDDIEETAPNIVTKHETTTTRITAETNCSVDATTADSTESITKLVNDTATYKDTPSSSNLNSINAVADTTSVAVVPDTTSISEPAQNVPSEDKQIIDKEIYVESNSQDMKETDKSTTLDKVSSTSQESVIKVNDSCVTGDVQINGSLKHIEVQDEKNDDDDIVFIEEKKFDIIVLDD